MIDSGSDEERELKDENKEKKKEKSKILNNG
jgi:hypothetical protein